MNGGVGDSESRRHAELAAAFDRTAPAYERGRPGYPVDLLASIATRVGIGPGRRVLDLGAGTGKLTRQLVDLGADVVAVEPLAAMRAELARVLPTVDVLDGTAEAIPLGAASVDVVAAGQAYHWFDQRRANPEIARVLRPGGHVVALWNFEDDSVPWIAELDSIKALADEHHRRRAAEWTLTVVGGSPFTAPEHITGRMEIEMTTAQLVDKFTSTSYVSMLDDEARAPLLDRVRSVVAGFEQPFTVPYLTHAYLWQRTSAPAS